MCHSGGVVCGEAQESIAYGEVGGSVIAGPSAASAAAKSERASTIWRLTSLRSVAASAVRRRSHPSSNSASTSAASSTDKSCSS